MSPEIGQQAVPTPSCWPFFVPKIANSLKLWYDISNMAFERAVEIVTRTSAVASLGLAVLSGTAAFAPEIAANTHFAVEELVDHNVSAMDASGRVQVHDQLLEGYTANSNQLFVGGLGALSAAALCMAVDLDFRRRNRQE
jgi:hypothetical protein